MCRVAQRCTKIYFFNKFSELLVELYIRDKFKTIKESESIINIKEGAANIIQLNKILFEDLAFNGHVM